MTVRYDVRDIDRRQAYMHLQSAVSDLREAALYLMADDRTSESDRATELQKQAHVLMTEIEVPGD